MKQSSVNAVVACSSSFHINNICVGERWKTLPVMNVFFNFSKCPSPRNKEQCWQKRCCYCAHFVTGQARKMVWAFFWSFCTDQIQLMPPKWSSRLTIEACYKQYRLRFIYLQSIHLRHYRTQGDLPKTFEKGSGKSPPWTCRSWAC